LATLGNFADLSAWIGATRHRAGPKGDTPPFLVILSIVHGVKTGGAVLIFQQPSRVSCAGFEASCGKPELSSPLFGRRLPLLPNKAVSHLDEPIKIIRSPRHPVLEWTSVANAFSARRRFPWPFAESMSSTRRAPSRPPGQFFFQVNYW